MLSEPMLSEPMLSEPMVSEPYISEQDILNIENNISPPPSYSSSLPPEYQIEKIPQLRFEGDLSERE